MRYLEIKSGPWPTSEDLPLWIRLLRRVIPSGNPDLEPYYENVFRWWVEINEKGEPLREIGFSAEGEAIVLAPVADNVGMMLDASDDWSNSDEDSTEATENFEAEWQALWPRFRKLDQSDKTRTQN